ncbi:Phosphatidylserine decarboxylase-related [Kalmanozyma brasiliensis GHG001]|uniref:Phosphatidylserine decarboxylase proenzyme 2 n=1 Tax=Kalmanozyma brasiliensis (strain GHG001) TaxID=1365824 RepID=V5EKH5_KALBG|nr:Phosphatidylserine decarboxylase-related [Kalmanozyma brasiliensis GHG001]EST05400.1 Phosphatidylserine decarboxylase-related [Kalmanozyma brasiliensis GHG001]
MVNQSSPSPPPSSAASGSASSAPLCTLRVQVLSAKGLAAKDRNGKSDPFVTVSLPGSAASSRHGAAPHSQTAVKQKTLDPTWKSEEATFEFPVVPDWYGPNFTAVASEQIDSSVVRAALQHVVVDTSSASSNHLTPDAANNDTNAKTRPRLGLRSASARKITGTASKILVTPVKLGAAGARVVGRQMPRPMRLRRRNRPSSSSLPADSLTSSDTLLVDGSKPPRGSIQLDASNGMVSSIEFVIWDKDRFSGDDYMGECSLPVTSWCREGLAEWSNAQSLWLPVESSHPHAKTSGELQVKVGFVSTSASPSDPAASAATQGPQSWSVDEVYNRLVLAALGTQGAAVRAVPASQSVGTTGPSEAFVDDGLSSDSEDDDDDDTADDEDDDDGLDTATSEGEPSDLNDGLEFDSDDEDVYNQHYETVAGASGSSSSQPMAASTSQSGSLLTPPPQQQKGGKVRRMFPRNISFRSNNNSGTATPVDAGSTSDYGPSKGTTPAEAASATGAKPRMRRRLPGVKRLKQNAAIPPSGAEGASATSTAPPRRAKRRGRGGRNRRGREYAFKAGMGMDIIGIVMMEVKGASDLPRWSNMTHTGFDMDPFAIISFGQKIFRTRVARHTLNPAWNEKLIFHVRRHETNFQAKFAVYDWDRMSSNDYVGGTQLSIADLLDAAPKADTETGLYKTDDEGTLGSMKEFVLPLTRVEKDEEAKYKTKRPTMTIQAKFTPYEALRQRFWQQLAQQFDTNDSGTLSRLELSSMLDSLGSTLSTKTLDSFFFEVSKNPEEDELTFEETIVALEKEVQKPWDLKRKATRASSFTDGTQTPSLLGGVGYVGSDTNQDMDVVGADAPDAGSVSDTLDPARPVPPGESGVSSNGSDRAAADATTNPGGMVRTLGRDFSALSLTSSTDSSSNAGGHSSNSAADSTTRNHKTRSTSGSSSGILSTSPSPTPPMIKVESREGSPPDDDDTVAVEHVVRLQSCPLCHLPRLRKKGEMDIITHLAVCASQDWRRVESLTVRNYVTATQAQRKWYTKVVNKISQGNYSLGANSANIIVQDRTSGELMEEKMQIYVRLGIRLLYKGARSRMEGARVKKMLKNMSVKQGVKFDSPASAREIPTFIAFHNLNTDEIRDPLDSYKTFNEFFYRKLKPNARPNEEPDNPGRLVSGADCRMMAFETVNEATKFWIKGRDFTVARLLGDAAKTVSNIDSYQNGGALAIFRLAPQDYHRFHCPADATVGRPVWITGQYYTVNPMAIRSAIDVYGENIRVVVPFHSEAFGTFYAVCIGAMMVGSTVLTVKEGDTVKRGQEFGFFKFGGSTIVLVFEEGRVTWDQDLVDNGRAAIETLVRVGMGIGRAGGAEAKTIG